MAERLVYMGGSGAGAVVWCIEALEGSWSVVVLVIVVGVSDDTAVVVLVPLFVLAGKLLEETVFVNSGCCC
jgi:hypothetical protein